MNLINFYRNTAFDERYDKNSFIGKILDYNIWSDTEYWKLEADLLQILKEYKNKNFNDEIMQGIVSICNDIFINSSWDLVDIDKKEKYFQFDTNKIEMIEPNIYDRFCRIKKLLISVSYGDENFFKINFNYKNE